MSSNSSLNHQSFPSLWQFKLWPQLKLNFLQCTCRLKGLTPAVSPVADPGDPVKISHKKEDSHIDFDVSCPPPYPAAGSATDPRGVSNPESTTANSPFERVA